MSTNAATGSHSELQQEDEHFRVIRWTIEPGGHIPMHEHAYEYVVVPLTGGTMHVENFDGSTTESHLIAGVSYSRPSGSRHSIANHDGSSPIIFVEVERLS